MSTLEVDVFDRNGKKLATYPMTLGGALDTQEDFKVEALRRAVEDNLISETKAPTCIVQVRLPPGIPPPAGWE
jgi:hypothetical protein